MLLHRGSQAVPTALCLIALGVAVRAAAEAPLDPHTHGAAELRLIVDGEQLEISLETPLDNLLGFEHAPRTDRERSAVRAMASRLRQAQTIFVPTPAARCSLAKVQLASSALAPELLGERVAPAAEKGKEPDGHADLDADFSWRCASPSQLKGLEVNLLQAFPGFRKLNVQVVSPKGQSATVLTPGQRAVSW